MFVKDKVNEETNESTDVVVSSTITDLKFTSFENAKRNIQSFANRNTADFGLATVPSSGGLFGLGDHKVTGDELNNVTSQVQGHLVKINGVTTDLIKEFGQVYTALESLDKEYIPAILSAVKGAEIASNQAKGAAEHAKVAQEDIRKTVKEQKKIIKVLEDHKAKLDKLKHLESVDDIWRASKELEKETKAFKSNLDDAKSQLSKIGESIKALQRFADGLLDYEHLDDIDDIWLRLGTSEETISLMSVNLEDVRAGIDRNVNLIDTIGLYMNQLKEYEHLEEIDTIWSDVQNTKKEISSIVQNQKSSDERINQQSADLSEVKAFVEDIKKQDHLCDIDTLWLQGEVASSEIGNINKKQTEISEAMDSFNSVQNGILEFDVKIEQESYAQKDALAILKQELESEKELHLSDIDNLKKQLYVSYGMAGTAILLSAVILILSIVGVF